MVLVLVRWSLISDIESERKKESKQERKREYCEAKKRSMYFVFRNGKAFSLIFTQVKNGLMT